MELSKKDKKVAREIIEKGLQKEYINSLVTTDNIITYWKKGVSNNREAYHSLYSHIVNFDKHIALRYNRMSGSNYLFIIAGQLIDEVISQADLNSFSEEAKLRVLQILEINKE